MPIISDCKYSYNDVSSRNYISDDRQGNDSVLLLNEVITINNSQGLAICNEHVYIKEDEGIKVLSESLLGKKNCKCGLDKSSQSFTLSRVVGFMASLVGVMFLGMAGGRFFYKKDQACLSIKDNLDLFNSTATDDVINAMNNSRDIFLLRSYKDSSPFSTTVFCNNVDLSQDQYLKEMLIIDNLSLPDINKLYQMVLSENHKRISRSITSSADHKSGVSEMISNIINNDDIDWRIREEFSGVYSKAINFPEIRQTIEGVEKDVKLILACISLMLRYLHENKINNLNNGSFLYGAAFIHELLRELDNVNASEVVFIDKRYKQSVLLMIRDIYSNKDNESYDESVVFNKKENEKLLKENDAYFYSFIRNAVLDKKSVTTVLPEPEIDNVKIVSLTSCQIERENLTTADVLRTLSRTIKSSLLNFIEETRIVYEYSFKNNGCPIPLSAETKSMIEKVSESLDSLMSLDATYNRSRGVSLIAAAVMNMIADELENKELSLDSVSDVNWNMVGLIKDLVSSLSTKQFKDINSASNNDEIELMVKNLKYKDNTLTINMENPRNVVSVEVGYNNFVDKETKRTIYYDSRNFWYISRDESYTENRQNVLESKYGFKLRGSDISIVKNSSPDLYADGTFIRTNDMTYVIVNEGLYHVSEMYVRDGIYRYVAHRDNIYTPVINIGGAWYFESKDSISIIHEVVDFLSGNEKIKSKLISDNIVHADVTPIQFSKKTQTDASGNNYLKSDNNYFLLRDGVCFSDYIEGGYDILPLKYSNGKYRFGYDIFGSMYNAYKKDLRVFSDIGESEIYYLDSSVIKKIHEGNLLEEAGDFIHKDDLETKYTLSSSRIEGAISISDDDFIVFNNKLIKIRSNNDDTFLLGGKNNIRAYKNIKSNTYYYVSDENNDNYRAQNFKIRDYHCIAKRQLFTLCSAKFYESKDITTRLSSNAEHGIHFDKPSDNLEPYADVHGFYKDKNNAEGFYFQSRNGIFFHAREEKNDDKMIPTFFKIYGKKADDSIDNNLLVSDVSIIKDFDTKELIITTPAEAMEMVFHLDSKKEMALSHWNKSRLLRKPINVNFKDLENIQNKINENEDLNLVKSLFSLHGKKVVSSKKIAIFSLKNKKQKFLIIQTIISLTACVHLKKAHNNRIS
ncbi:hypothetical protein [Candidatus Symbiopectobacterium sp. NZEC135]|uniref:hypothetical protein n=1 Tax=Candidatus Symbiopectobacterium sp. NZEC135 TaxID=2820471 RepID=UPI002226E12A|nr:hypothetical protein [Candidatus Symbiopectobacterium sp. NZEC135]MCW2477621.1 hypothetical protein [Candidatus Symbiopectobacterium sp. NZEC135]